MWRLSSSPITRKVCSVPRGTKAVSPGPRVKVFPAIQNSQRPVMTTNVSSASAWMWRGGPLPAGDVLSTMLIRPPVVSVDRMVL